MEELQTEGGGILIFPTDGSGMGGRGGSSAVGGAHHAPAELPASQTSRSGCVVSGRHVPAAPLDISSET